MENLNIISIYKADGLKVMLVTNGHSINDVLEAFENVLRGSGYFFKGNLVIDEETSEK